MSLVNPSFANGFASPWYGGRMKYADLWRGCVGAWAPILGPTGATLFDFSGWQGHGAINATIANAWVVRQFGQCLDLNGSSDYVSASAKALGAAGDYTISTWIRPESWTNFRPIYDRDSGILELYVQDTSLITLHNRAGSIHYKFWPLPTLNVWSHVCVVFSGSTWTVYFNGVPQTGSGELGTSAPTSTTGSVTIGKFAATGGSYDGQIATLSVWNRAITPSEAVLLAQRPGIMYELDDSDVWGAVEAGGSVPWWAFANRQSRIIGGGVT